MRGVKAFSTSEVGGKAKCLGLWLIGLMIAVNVLNVVNSYVGRDFMTAVENRNVSGFAWQAFFYILVFAASTGVAVYVKYSEERLGLLWRKWLTKRLIDRYMERRNFYRLYASGEITNPDQRITDDVKAFTVTTLSFTLMFLNGAFTVVAFSGVLWLINPWLFGAAVLYAGIGSWASYYLGHSLVGLNYNQFDKEALFRADFVHVRENAESIALLHREERLKSGMMHHLGELVTNFKNIILVNRNLGFFTIGYNYLAQIVPILIVAPLFFRGEIEFGVVTQSAMAFTHLLGAFSLIVTNFQSISTFTAVIARLGSLEEAIDNDGQRHVLAMEQDAAAVPAESPAEAPAIEITEENDHVEHKHLTLLSPHDGRKLVKDLTVRVPFGTRLLISGPNEDAKMALFRATAGIWSGGEGQIVRPPFGQIYFLPERPYLPSVTLRELLVRTGQEEDVADELLIAELRALRIDSVIKRAGGFDVAHNWKDILSLGEQQLLAFVRLVLVSPRFVFLERVGHALSREDAANVLEVLAQKSITYITVGRHGVRDDDDKLKHYDAVLELMVDGNWIWSPIKEGKIATPAK
ncbi:MAG: ABC transporter ATP-binding protein/permease [Methylococcaceae bacterium]|nr:MAG: ABC transporter ATP-binding protein/permease [Methylococcaceae bacterium]